MRLALAVDPSAATSSNDTCEKYRHVRSSVASRGETICSVLMKRRHGVNPVEHFLHDGIGRRLSVERDGQIGPDGQEWPNTNRSLGSRRIYFRSGEMPGYNSFMGYDPVNDVTLIK